MNANPRRVTAGDVLRIEKLRDTVSDLHSLAECLTAELWSVHHEKLPSTIKLAETGAKMFGRDDDTPVAQLKRELILGRLKLRALAWEQWMADVRAAHDALGTAIRELETENTLSAVLAGCPD